MTASADPLSACLEAVGSRPTVEELVEALVPEFADIAAVFIRRQERLHLTVYKTIDPRQIPALAEFQRLHTPRIDDPVSVVARVARTGTKALVSWISKADLEQIENPRVRELFESLGSKNVVAVPLEADMDRYGVLVGAMAASRRKLVDDDVQFWEQLARQVGPTLVR